MDWEGQKLTEQLMQIMLLGFAVVALATGYFIGSFMMMLQIYGAGVVLTTLITVPNWPFFNRHPLKWLDPIEAERHPLKSQPLPVPATSTKKSSSKSHLNGLKSEGEALHTLMKKFTRVNGSERNPPDYINLSWNNLSSFNTPCNWAGVLCNSKNTHIVSLTLQGVEGQLGSEIGQLKYLKKLDLGMSKFSGSIPMELWNCSHLQDLDLQGNHFTGELPEAVGNLFRLNEFDVSLNQLSGRIPQSLFQIPGLEIIYLSGNNLNGSIPCNMGNATNLKNVMLDNNELHGIIPISIANCTQLSSLWLNNNHLNGEIPLGVWRIPTVDTIVVENKNLSGKLPVEMSEQLGLTQIDLSDNHFSGLISEALGINSTDLQFVNFSNNSFSGEIPPNLCFGKQLWFIDLSRNQFSGTIPQSYTRNCYSLRTLSLQGNNLTNSFPVFDKNMTNIDILDISKNNIHGNIPSSICNLSFLLLLDLSDNQITGILPECLGHLNKLQILDLRNNHFRGRIPSNFTIKSVYMLDLNGNNFEGKIPRSIIYSQSLQYLDLGNNQLNDTFPFFLKRLPSLEILILHSNKLYGPLKHPDTHLGAFSRLKVIDISSNYFSGDLPIQFFLGLDAMKQIEDNTTYVSYNRISMVMIHKGKELILNQTLLTKFRAIDLSNNSFRGRIPEGIGELVMLKSLNLSHNNFYSRIPSSLGNLTQLESLDLSQNKLFGGIPSELTSLSFLSIFNVSHNNLTGPIPNTGQFQTYSNDSFTGNPGLCGYQSSVGCKKVAGLDGMEENESEEDSKWWNFGWEPVVIGYGCGVVLALVIQYFLFTKANMYKWFR